MAKKEVLQVMSETLFDLLCEEVGELAPGWEGDFYEWTIEMDNCQMSPTTLSIPISAEVEVPDAS